MARNERFPTRSAPTEDEPATPPAADPTAIGPPPPGAEVGPDGVVTATLPEEVASETGEA